MYCSFFGLTKNPFGMAPDSEFLFLTPKHREAVAGLACAISGRKGFLVLSGEAGTGKTTVLTWMSERRKPVFIVATANDISRLPPEMVRKGRFDEIFFVDLPSASNRSDILKIHLQKRNLESKKFDLEALTKATEGFSGSEIEQAIVSAMYTAHAQGRELSQADLLTEIRQTRPLSVVMSENVEGIRRWATDRTVPCD